MIKRNSSHAGFISASSRSIKGFTLIELLVVVLIIGILAAVAVPMYKHATIKSQFSAVMPPTKSLADAQEVFYLNNGEYAEDKDELDLSIPDTTQTTVNVSTKRNYKYVMGHHAGVPGANYIVYQKNSKRFSGNVHCEAAKTDDNAQWLCEKGLGGTPITGSISGADYLTYLLSGETGTDRFIREDCPAGYYDDEGTCTISPRGHYAEEGELKPCEVGTWTGDYWISMGRTSCSPCPAGKYSETEGTVECTACPSGTYQPETGATSCIPCPVGTWTGGYWQNGKTACSPCPEGQYADTEGTVNCKSCPSGQTSNADHTGCVPV